MIYWQPVTYFRRVLRVAHQQSDLIKQKDREISVLQHCILAHQRALHSMAISFRLSLEQPEVDIRSDLDMMIRELGEQLAQTEEFVV